MLPAHPALPTACSFPFQPAEAGNQTSILISESLDGFSVAARRQNAGRLAYENPRPRPTAGLTKAPGDTVCASVIVVFGSESAARLSHVAAIALVETRVVIAASPARAASPETRAPIFILRSMARAPRRCWCPAVVCSACCE